MANIFYATIWRTMPGVDFTARNNRGNLPDGFIPCKPILRQYIDAQYINESNKLPMFKFKGDEFEVLWQEYKKVCIQIHTLISSLASFHSPYCSIL